MRNTLHKTVYFEVNGPFGICIDGSFEAIDGSISWISVGNSIQVSCFNDVPWCSEFHAHEQAFIKAAYDIVSRSYADDIASTLPVESPMSAPIRINAMVG